MKKTTNRIVNRIPGFYTRGDRSVLISLIDSIVPEIDHLYELVQQVSDMININKVHDCDIYERFGSMFNLYKYSYEDYDTYRARVRATVAEKYGGVPQIIKNTVAGYAGITNSNDVENGIHVVGAWDYDGHIPDDIRKPGYFVVTIDENLATKHVQPSMLKDVVNSVKAAGVRVYLVITFDRQYDEFVINVDEEFWQSIKHITTDGYIIVGNGDLCDIINIDNGGDMTTINGNDDHTIDKGITKYESSMKLDSEDRELTIHTKHSTEDISQFDVGIDLSDISLLNDSRYITNSTLITNIFKLNIKSTAEKLMDIVKYHVESEDSYMIMNDIIRSICDYINDIYESSMKLDSEDRELTIHTKHSTEDKYDNIAPLMTDEIPLTAIKQVDDTQMSFNDEIPLTAVKQTDNILLSSKDEELTIHTKHNTIDIYDITVIDVGHNEMTINGDDGMYIGGNDVYTFAGTNNGICKLNDTFVTNLQTMSSHYDIIKQLKED